MNKTNLYEAYLNRSIKVNLPAGSTGYFILEEDTKINVDPETNQALYGKYLLTFPKAAYTVVC